MLSIPSIKLPKDEGDTATPHILRSRSEVYPIRCGFSPMRDFFRFTCEPRLLEIIREISISQIFPHDIPPEEAEIFYESVLELKAKFWVQHDAIVGSTNYFCDISSKFVDIFFDSVEILQKEDPKISIPLNLFNRALENFQQLQPCLASVFVKRYRKNISPYVALKKYKAEALKEKDPKMALLIAQYYGSHNCALKNNFKCPTWLLRAHDFCQKKKIYPESIYHLSPKRISEIVDLDSFLKSLKVTECYSEIFYKGYEEIAEAFAKCPTVKKVHLLDVVRNCDLKKVSKRQLLPGLSRFITLSQSVEEVNYDGCYKKPNLEAIKFFALAILTNTSIKRLKISSTMIPYEGIQMIARAILDKPSCQIVHLRFISCNLTNESASCLAECIEKTEEIRYLEISQARWLKISDSIQKRIHEIIWPRL